MNKLPFISIGLPVYNGERFLKETLNSVLNQTYQNFELIISDNASTDLTQKICREYKAKDNRVRYIRQKINKGGINNFKNVLDAAKGKYFMWIAADDMLGNQNYLQIISNKISNKYDFYFTEVSIIDDKCKIIKSRIMQSFVNCKTQFDYLKASLNISSHQFYGLHERLKLIEDWKYLEICKDYKCFNEGLFVHAISAKRKGKFIKNTIKLYRLHANNWSSSLKARELIVSFLLYTLRSIHLILTLRNFSYIEKKKLLFIKLYFSIKYLLILILGTIWQTLNLQKFLFFLKLKKRIFK